jgi:predicted nucleotidyltransferase component of viral defense system
LINSSQQLKALINNKAGGDSRKAQLLQRNYMMERFLERLSVSSFKDDFILKGGVLISAMVGTDMRSTMDIDVTIRNIPMTEAKIRDVVNTISAIPLDDNVEIHIESVNTIMDDAEYGGIRITANALLDSMIVPLKVDISTGDVITPREINFEFPTMFGNREITLWTYNLETILAEKLETILSRSTVTTRMRDFYDLCILQKTGLAFSESDFAEAYRRTCTKRGSLLDNPESILSTIEEDSHLQVLWRSYQKKYDYAALVDWDAAIKSARNLLQVLEANT